MNITALQEELTRLTIFFTTMTIIATAIGLWVLYEIIKAAVREGIKESGLIEQCTRNAPTKNENKDEAWLNLKADR